MFIAVSNRNGWGKALTLEDARTNAQRESFKGFPIKVKTWECATDEAYVDGMGTVYGVKPDTSQVWERSGPRSAWKAIANE